MKRTLFIVFLASVCFFITGCLPAKKKIVIPDYDRYKKPETKEQVEAAPPKEGALEVPGALPGTADLDRDEVFKKHDETETPAAPVPEEVDAGSDETETAIPGTGTGQFSPAFPEPEYVSQRLQVYTRALQEWNGMAEKMVALDAGASAPEDWLECVQGLEYMVSGYTLMNSLLQTDGGQVIVPLGMNPWDIVQSDVHYLESGCDELFRRGQESLDNEISAYKHQDAGSLKAMMRQLMGRSDFQGAVSAYENSEAVRRGERVDFTSQAMYARALVQEGRLDDAVRFMGGNLFLDGVTETPHLAESKEVLQVAMDYADLLMVQGQDVKAKSAYLRLDEFFAAYESESEWVAGQLRFLNDYRRYPEKYEAFLLLLKEYVSCDGRRVPNSLRAQYEKIIDDFDDVGLESSAKLVLRRTEERVRQWVRARIEEADYLSNEKEFSAAREVLEGLENLPEDMQMEVADVMQAVVNMEKEDARMRVVLEKEELAAQWEKAMDLLGAEEYEKAIDAFSSLSSSEYGAEAEKKEAEAIDKLAVRLRKEAADLFVAARSAKDPARQAEMMVRSREILLNILNKYPGAEIVGKVEQNLRVLEDQIRAYNPNLLGGEKVE